MKTETIWEFQQRLKEEAKAVLIKAKQQENEKNRKLRS